jgi:hypothetical protein
MSYEEPMKQWVMQEIKEIIRMELSNVRDGHAIALKIACPFTLRSMDVYIKFCYDIERYPFTNYGNS